MEERMYQSRREIAREREGERERTEKKEGVIIETFQLVTAIFLGDFGYCQYLP